MRRIHSVIEGTTPQGRPFSIETSYDAGTGLPVVRRLNWLPVGDVGNIGVPMYRECWYGELYYYLTREGEVPDYLARNCFATFEGGQKFNHPSLP